MKPVYDSWTVVVPGSWNPRIFTPEWTAREIFDGAKQVQVEMVISPGENQFRVLSEDLVIVPSESRILVGVKSKEDSTLERADEALKRILSKLPHSPVSAIGYNFSFREVAPTPDLLNLFELSDKVKIAQSDFQVDRYDVQRRLKKSGDQVALSFRASFENGDVELHGNYHQDLSSAAEILRSFDRSFISYRDQFLKFLYESYGLSDNDEEVDA